jgi:hypothetical protein
VGRLIREGGVMGRKEENGKVSKRNVYNILRRRRNTENQ